MDPDHFAGTLSVDYIQVVVQMIFRVEAHDAAVVIT